MTDVDPVKSTISGVVNCIHVGRGWQGRSLIESRTSHTSAFIVKPGEQIIEGQYLRAIYMRLRSVDHVSSEVEL